MFLQKMKQSYGLENMAWFNHIKPKIKSQLYSSLVISLLTVYTFWMLTVMDRLLLHTIKGYQAVDSFWLGSTIFFVASHIFIHLFQAYKWKNYLFYYMGGLATFFPLVLLTSMLRVSLGVSEDSFSHYREAYCSGMYAESTSICGLAFASIVYSMTMRALPIVLTIPILYRWFYIDFPVFINKSLLAFNRK